MRLKARGVPVVTLQDRWGCKPFEAHLAILALAPGAFAVAIVSADDTSSSGAVSGRTSHSASAASGRGCTAAGSAAGAAIPAPSRARCAASAGNHAASASSTCGKKMRHPEREAGLQLT
jgi:hypothetical protein